MSLPDLFTTAQLEIACGGADRLMRLAKARVVNDATYSSFIAEVKAMAFGKVRGVVGPAFSNRDPTVQTAELLSQYALMVGVWSAHFKGSGGMEIPPNVQKGFDLALEGLGEIRDGESSLGTEADPTTQLTSGVVNMDASGSSGSPGSGWTRKNWGGFC